MISARYALPVVVLLGLALVPTVVHSYADARAVDSLQVRAIPDRLAGMTSVPTGRKAKWVEEKFEADDWIERTYVSPQGPTVLFAARSYDAKRLYHHPELALLRDGMLTQPYGLHRLPEAPRIPLQVIATDRRGRTGLAVYTLLYNGRYVADPIRFQLEESLRLMVSRPHEMTLLFANDFAGTVTDVAHAPATRIVLAAAAAFESQR